MARNVFRFKRLPDRVTFLKIELERQFNKFKIHFPLMRLKITKNLFENQQNPVKKKNFEIFLNEKLITIRIFLKKRYSIFLCSFSIKFLRFFLGFWGICVCELLFEFSRRVVVYLAAIQLKKISSNCVFFYLSLFFSLSSHLNV